MTPQICIKRGLQNEKTKTALFKLSSEAIRVCLWLNKVGIVLVRLVQ
jgi:hypothetical protein